jgi:hypothetical protein
MSFKERYLTEDLGAISTGNYHANASKYSTPAAGTPAMKKWKKMHQSDQGTVSPEALAAMLAAFGIGATIASQ